MKQVKLLLIAVFTLCTSSLFAQTDKTDSIKVNGECGMCKSRIQRTLKAEAGIVTATWDTETKVLAVTYNPDKITNEDIQKKLAAVGHDTEKFQAPDEVYAKLPGCCKYERKKL